MTNSVILLNRNKRHSVNPTDKLLKQLVPDIYDIKRIESIFTFIDNIIFYGNEGIVEPMSSAKYVDMWLW
jgi:hypothetical protein